MHVWKSSSLASEMEGHLRLGHQSYTGLNVTPGPDQKNKHLTLAVAAHIRTGFNRLGNLAGNLRRWRHRPPHRSRLAISTLLV